MNATDFINENMDCLTLEQRVEVRKVYRDLRKTDSRQYAKHLVASSLETLVDSFGRNWMFRKDS